MLLSYGSATDTGRRRSHNEDSLLVDFDPRAYPASPALFVVCDGVGGALAGKTASNIAVAEVSRAFRASGQQDLAGRLVDAAERASAAIYERSTSDPATEGMATTLVAVAVDAERCYVVNVGDSRVYRADTRGLHRITTDHTLVQDQLSTGLITPEQASVSPYRHIITRSLGRETADIGAEIYPPLPLTTGDVFVLCTDGLTEMVEDRDIHAIVMSKEPPMAARALVDRANANGGHDNVTVIVVRVD